MLDKLNSEECEMCVFRESIRGQNSWRNTHADSETFFN